MHMMWSRRVIGPLRPMVWFLALHRLLHGCRHGEGCLLHFADVSPIVLCVRSPALSAMALSFDNRLFGAIGLFIVTVSKTELRKISSAGSVSRAVNACVGSSVPPQDPPLIFASLRQNCTARLFPFGKEAEIDNRSFFFLVHTALMNFRMRRMTGQPA